MLQGAGAGAGAGAGMKMEVLRGNAGAEQMQRQRCRGMQRCTDAVHRCSEAQRYRQDAEGQRCRVQVCRSLEVQFFMRRF